MSAFWLAPLLLAVLSLLWFAVQRAWLVGMQLPSDSDALDRPGGCGNRCACRADCPNRAPQHPVASSSKESSA